MKTAIVAPHTSPRYDLRRQRLLIVKRDWRSLSALMEIKLFIVLPRAHTGVSTKSVLCCLIESGAAAWVGRLICPISELSRPEERYTSPKPV